MAQSVIDAPLVTSRATVQPVLERLEQGDERGGGPMIHDAPLLAKRLFGLAQAACASMSGGEIAIGDAATRLATQRGSALFARASCMDNDEQLALIEASAEAADVRAASLRQSLKALRVFMCGALLYASATLDQAAKAVHGDVKARFKAQSEELLALVYARQGNGSDNALVGKKGRDGTPITPRGEAVRRIAAFMQRYDVLPQVLAAATPLEGAPAAHTALVLFEGIAAEIGVHAMAVATGDETTSGADARRALAGIVGLSALLDPSNDQREQGAHTHLLSRLGAGFAAPSPTPVPGLAARSLPVRALCSAAGDEGVAVGAALTVAAVAAAAAAAGGAEAEAATTPAAAATVAAVAEAVGAAATAEMVTAETMTPATGLAWSMPARAAVGATALAGAGAMVATAVTTMASEVTAAVNAPLGQLDAAGSAAQTALALFSGETYAQGLAAATRLLDNMRTQRARMALSRSAARATPMDDGRVPTPTPTSRLAALHALAARTEADARHALAFAAPATGVSDTGDASASVGPRCGVLARHAPDVRRLLALMAEIKGEIAALGELEVSVVTPTPNRASGDCLLLSMKDRVRRALNLDARTSDAVVVTSARTRLADMLAADAERKINELYELESSESDAARATALAERRRKFVQTEAKRMRTRGEYLGDDEGAVHLAGLAGAQPWFPSVYAQLVKLVCAPIAIVDLTAQPRSLVFFTDGVALEQPPCVLEHTGEWMSRDSHFERLSSVPAPLTRLLFVAEEANRLASTLRELVASQSPPPPPARPRAGAFAPQSVGGVALDAAADADATLDARAAIGVDGAGGDDPIVAFAPSSERDSMPASVPALALAPADAPMPESYGAPDAVGPASSSAQDLDDCGDDDDGATSALGGAEESSAGGDGGGGGDEDAALDADEGGAPDDTGGRDRKRKRRRASGRATGPTRTSLNELDALWQVRRSSITTQAQVDNLLAALKRL